MEFDILLFEGRDGVLERFQSGVIGFTFLVWNMVVLLVDIGMISICMDFVCS